MDKLKVYHKLQEVRYIIQEVCLSESAIHAESLLIQLDHIVVSYTMEQINDEELYDSLEKLLENIERLKEGLRTHRENAEQRINKRLGKISDFFRESVGWQ